MASYTRDPELLAFECGACKAQPGQPCRTMRHHPGRPHPVGYVTQPHDSRWRRRRQSRQRKSR